MFALIPLFYQLLEAYHPQSYTPPTITIVEPTPINVLGVSTIPSPAPVPLNVGGEGEVITIGVLGDSMIETLGIDLPTLKNSLRQYFPGHVFNLLNFGTGSQTVEYGLQHELPDLITQHPDIVVIESFAYNNFGNTQAGYDRHRLALGAITTTIQQQLPQAKIIIAATIAPNSIVFGNGIKDLHLSSLDKIEKANTTQLYLQNAINFASSAGFPVADTYHLSLLNNDGQREFISSTDNLHPSASGATLFSDVVADTISRHKLLD